jgi:hypothetical protein
MKITLNELMTVAELEIGNLGRAMTRRAFRVACTSGQVHCPTTPLRLRSVLLSRRRPSSPVGPLATGPITGLVAVWEHPAPMPAHAHSGSILTPRQARFPPRRRTPSTITLPYRSRKHLAACGRRGSAPAHRLARLVGALAVEYAQDLFRFPTCNVPGQSRIAALTRPRGES